MHLIVTRPQAQAAGWVRELQALGLAASALPLIEITALDDPAPLRQAWRDLSQRTLVMFVSANAVEHFFAAAPPGRGWPAGVLAGSTGPGTSAALRSAGVPVPLLVEPAADAPKFDSEALWERLASRQWAGLSVLVVRGEDGRLRVMNNSKDTFVLREWLAGDADARDVRDASLADDVRCDSDGCVVAGRDGRLVALARAPAALEDDCPRAALVVTAWPVPSGCAAQPIGTRADGRAQEAARGGRQASRRGGEGDAKAPAFASDDGTDHGSDPDGIFRTPVSDGGAADGTAEMPLRARGGGETMRVPWRPSPLNTVRNGALALWQDRLGYRAEAVIPEAYDRPWVPPRTISPHRRTASAPLPEKRVSSGNDGESDASDPRISVNEAESSP